MNALIFLGSGVSYASGLPKVEELTHIILNGEWHRHTDSNYYPGQHPNNEYFRKNEFSKKIQKFLNYLKGYADKYMKTRGLKEATYEDIYFLVRQLHDELSGETDNPVIGDLISKIRIELDVDHNPDFSDIGTQLDFKDFCWRAEDFINCVVWQSLYTKNPPTGFDLIAELNGSNLFERIDIATLNHDLLVEKYLESQMILFTDGFSLPDGDFCYFKPDEYKISNNKVRLFKLHGSIDLYRMRTLNKDTDTTTDFYAKVSGNHWRMRDANGNFVGDTLNSYPIFLTGTMNKLSDYNFGIIRTIHLIFDEVLRSHDTMIMSGYGWNDKGINGRLMEWILSSSDKKLILLHEDPESIKKSRSAMWHSYDNLVKWGRLIPVKKWFSDTRLEDIIDYLE